MKKRLLPLLLAAAMTLSLLSTVAFAAEVTAAPSAATVLLDGKKVAFEAYAINSNNYFKLRDLAMAFNGTKKQFNVGYNNGMVEITTGSPYTPVGGELSPGSGAAVAARPGNAEVFFAKESYKISMAAYAIGGNNFVKLRDLMQWLNVYVGYDTATATITLDTGKPYDLPMAIDNPLAGQSAVDNKTRADFGNSPGIVTDQPSGVYYKGYYYTLFGNYSVLKIKEGGGSFQELKMNQSCKYENLQIYNDKIIVEGQERSSVDMHYTFTMNLDGSGRKQLWEAGLQEEGHNNTVYKGKIYANTFTAKQSVQIVRHELDGTGRKVLYEEDGTNEIAYTVEGRETHLGIKQVFAVYNDRIYFFENIKGEGGRQIISINLDGGDRQVLGNTSHRFARIINVYDGYLYYSAVPDKRSNGDSVPSVYRSNLDGSDVRCILPGFATCNWYFMNYGDKILFSAPDQVLGVANNDGSNRRQMPNSPKGAGGSVGNAVVMNETYTMAGLAGDEGFPVALLRNNAATPGHIYIVETPRSQGATPAWRDVQKPFAQGIAKTSISTGKPADGTYFIVSAQNQERAVDAAKEWVTGGNLKFGVLDGSLGQKITLKNVGGDQFTIIMNLTELAVSSAGEKGGGIGQSKPAAGDARQIFTITDQGDGTYRIQDSTGLYFAASAGVAKDREDLCLWTKSEKEAGQRFVLKRIVE